MRQITITKNDEAQRLDKFLSKFMPTLPKSMLYKSLRKNCVKINGKHAKDGSVMLKEGDILCLYFKDEFFEKEEEKIIPNSDIDIVYEDENFIIVNKPRAMPVHADDKGRTDTLIDRIKSYLYKTGAYSPASEQSFVPALCNRLDQNTSGLVIAAKNAAALRLMNEKIRNHELKKFYLCITEGIPPKTEGEAVSFLIRHEKIVEVSGSKTDGAKLIRTKYKVLDTDTKNRALVEIELLTGRTHQIRAQMSYLGCPLEGDVKYGARRIRGGYVLCSYRLVFDFHSEGLEYLRGKEIILKNNIIRDFK